MHKEINFSPFATNIIDCCNRDDLCTPSGIQVTIKNLTGGFTVYIGTNQWDDLSNAEASYILNSNQVGTT